MAVLEDELYLENIQEYVQDENRIVSYKWLSRTLSVPVNAAKQMLYSFVNQYKSSGKQSPLSVLYFISGEVSSDDEKSIQFKLVSENELEDVKSMFSTIWTVHIYSVQKSPIVESSMLYASDYQSTFDNLKTYEKWNTIICEGVSQPRVKPQSPQSLPLKPWSCNIMDNSTETSKDESTCKNESRNTTNLSTATKSLKSTTKKRPIPKGSVASFFNKKTSDSKQSSTQEKIKTTKKVESPKQIKPQSTSDSSETVSHLSDSKITLESEDLQQITKEKTVSDMKPKATEKKMFTGLRDSDFEDNEVSSSEETVPKKEVITKSKRGRPAGSKKAKVKVQTTKPKKKRRRVQEMSSDESDSEVTNKIAKQETSSNSNGREQSHGKVRRRKRIRRLVTKMFADEDGSMITEKHWEEISTDASSDEEIKEKAKEGSSSLATKISKIEISSPGKKTKQSSLMSFFKK